MTARKAEEISASREDVSTSLPMAAARRSTVDVHKEDRCEKSGLQAALSF